MEVSIVDENRDNPFYDVEDVASYTECTGLMPALPRTEDQDENLASLYAVHKGLRSHRRFRR